MNDAVPQTETRRNWQDVWPLQPLPMDVVPPLATLSSLAAFASMILNQVVLPSLGSGIHSPHYARVAQASRFAANLGVTTGLITLVACVAWALVGQPRLSLRRQLFAFTAAGLLAYVALGALLFTGSATREQIYFGVASANLIGMALGSTALARTRGWFLRGIALAMTGLSVFNILVIVLEFVPDAQLDPWARQAALICRSAGELTYLILLFAAFPLLVPRGLRARDLLARSLGFAVFAVSMYAQRTAQHALRADFGLLLYSAQRVSLILDRWPFAYALPFCLILAAVTTALLSGGTARIQAASGMLAIFAAGYATRAPGRLLSLGIGYMLLARALIAFTEQAPFRSIAPPPSGKISVPPREPPAG